MLNKPSDFFIKICEIRATRPDDIPKAGSLPDINDHYGVKLGNTTVITGYPTCGKSYFLINMQVALSVKYGWKHLIYTPEMGEVEEVVLTIIEIVAGVRSWKLTDTHISSLMPWIDEHFTIMDFENTPTMQDICEEAIKQAGKYQTFSIDNMNDLSHTIVGTMDIYFESQLVMFNRAAKKAKMHGFLTAHPRNPEPNDITSPPSPDKIKGGSAWWSKSQSIISLMRLGDLFTIQFYKIKPRIVGKQGKIEIKVDMDRNTYYQPHLGKFQYMFNQSTHQEEQQGAF